MKKIMASGLLLISAISNAQEVLQFPSPEVLKRSLKNKEFDTFAAATKIVSQLADKTLPLHQAAFIIEEALYDYDIFYAKHPQKRRELNRSESKLIEALFEENPEAYEKFNEFEKRTREISLENLQKLRMADTPE